MKRIFDSLAALVGAKRRKKEQDISFPPVPVWQPDFAISVDQVEERMVYYTDNGKDLVILDNGTVVLLPDGLTDDEAEAFARDTLSKILNYHPDMQPLNMDDGNILIQYNHPACNVVINEFADEHMETIRKRHEDGLTPSEVIITPLGSNVFDDFGMKALYGRTFMFMDAQNPSVVRIYRHGS